jgi:hypothetical protein
MNKFEQNAQKYIEKYTKTQEIAQAKLIELGIIDQNNNLTENYRTSYNMKQYIGISRDHSGSMYTIANAAMKDYNISIDSIRSVADKNNIDTIVSVVKCGVGYGTVEREIINSNVNTLKPLYSYDANGRSTPLFDSVNDLINMLSSVPDKDDPAVSFLVMVITDGAENSSRSITGTGLGMKIRELQNTDKWTFIFRVPRGHTKALTKLGIPEGNILEWDQTNSGMQASTQATTQAFENYYTDRSKGIRSTKGFYSNLSNVTISDIKSSMKDITSECTIYGVYSSTPIADFVLQRRGHKIEKGKAFYELTKHEKEIQEYKKICIASKKDGRVYEGSSARTMLGLPTYGSISLSPGDHGDYKIYIQSTSLNRKLLPGTELLYWENA